MPVRIYEISKKLGLENKVVLAKAKELGITAAKVASSSLDKITAEYLEEQIAGKKPEETAPAAPPAEEQIVVVTSHPEVEAQAAQAQEAAPAPTATEVAPAAEAEAEVKAEAPAAPETPVEAPAAPAPVEAERAEPPAAEPPPKPEPSSPQIGDKIGFIKLPSKPAPRVPDRGAKPAPSAPQQRGPGGFSRPDQNRGRVDLRQGKGPNAPYGRTGRGPETAQRLESGRPGAPVAPKFTAPADAQVITLKPPIIVRELAEQLGRKPFQIIADLMELNVFANVNQGIDEETARKVCAKHGFRFEAEKRERGGGIVHAPIKTVELDIEDKAEDLLPRAPVVTIMGHVDHGKTTLLDVIRKTNVVAGEAGGITQHIGAYTISFPHPERKGELQQITFLDTPGHAAFSSMRARGANVTDIVILVVAATDGVMPQTVEALSHARAAKVPIMVAVNKCDHPNANPMKARQQLQEKGLVPDDWGGETPFVDVSALTKQGVDKLLSLLILQADLLELKANPNRRALGNVIESGLEPGGPTATVLIRKGTLRTGDTVISGQYWGRVRALINEEGKRLKEAGPSVAVKLLGLNGVPEAGLEFTVLENDKTARELGEQRAQEARSESQEARSKVTLENLFATLDATTAKVLKVVIKADTQGSTEAICEALKKIDTDKVSIDIIHSAVGTITDSDVTLASASNAVILGFHTRIDNGVSDSAKREGVQIKLYSIIYELIDEVKEAMAGLLEPVLKETTVGVAEVRKVFDLSKGSPVAGCIVSSGRITKGKVRVMRRKGLIYEGAVQSLRRFQEEVNEVRNGMECGIRVDGFGDFEPGDTIECYSIEKVAQKL